LASASASFAVTRPTAPPATASATPAPSPAKPRSSPASPPR
jgi:hypothetical protein